MAIPEFRRPPNRHELREFSKAVPEWAEKRRKKAENIIQFREHIRELEKTDPETARRKREYFLPPAEMVQGFYKRVEEEYKTLPLEDEQIEQLFSAEHLAGLSLEEYVELLRKVPPRFMTHITRQGVRDNMSHHSGGYGVMNRGFEQILEAGAIRSTGEQYLFDGITQGSVQSVLENHLKIPQEFPTRADAMRRITRFLHTSAEAPHSTEFADLNAVHVAIDKVADGHYGGERENEIFFLYPAAFVAANYRIGTQRLAIPDRFTPDDKYIRSEFNDFWLMHRETRRGELPVDAAIVFLPAKTQVDPESGSRYALDKDEKPIPNTDQIDRIKKMACSPEFEEHANSLYHVLLELYAVPGNISKLLKEADQLDPKAPFFEYDAEKKRAEAEALRARLPELQAAFDPLRALARQYGVSDERFYELMDNPDFFAHEGLKNLLGKAQLAKFRKEKQRPYDLEDELENDPNIFIDMGLQFTLAEKTISSQEYWERYFEKHKRPSKVIYYEQELPAEALRVFRERAGLVENGLHQRINLKELFAHNLGGTLHGELEHEKALFQQYAEEVLDRLYPGEATAENARPLDPEGLFADTMASFTEEELRDALSAS